MKAAASGVDSSECEWFSDSLSLALDVRAGRPFTMPQHISGKVNAGAGSWAAPITPCDALGAADGKCFSHILTCNKDYPLVSPNYALGAVGSKG